jgi:hypothetical protein
MINNPEVNLYMRITGYLISGIGLAGLIYFRSYTGTEIQLQSLWLACCILLMAAGMFLVVKGKLNAFKSDNKYLGELDRIHQLRLNGEKVTITLENVEIKTRSYRKEVSSDGMSKIEMLDGLYGNTRNYREEDVIQTYIVFQKRINNLPHKFISQPFSSNEFEVRNAIAYGQGCILYIDRFNPRNYHYDILF